MGIGDTSAALEIMRDANNDFLEFIRNLRTFLTGKGPITFNIGEGYTVSSLQDVIQDYRNGVFDELLLGGQNTGTQLRLYVDSNGNLVISDLTGNPATLLCAAVSTSRIDNCTADEVTASHCRIDSILGAVSIEGGTVNLDSLRLDTLVTQLLSSDNMTVTQLSVTGNLSCPVLLSYGSRKFVPRVTRNVFYRNNQAYNNAAASMEFTALGDWIMTDWYGGTSHTNSLKPGDIGFSTTSSAAPDLVCIKGTNKYSDFTYRSGVIFTVQNPMPVPPNVKAYVSGPTGSTYTELPITGNPEFAALLMWPTGVMPTIQQGSGILYMTSFAPSDLGKEIYYEVHENPWKVYRIMRITYDASDNSVPVSVTFEGLVDLPAYTFGRYVLKAHDSLFDKSMTTGSASRVVVYALE